MPTKIKLMLIRGFYFWNYRTRQETFVKPSVLYRIITDNLDLTINLKRDRDIGRQDQEIKQSSGNTQEHSTRIQNTHTADLKAHRVLFVYLGSAPRHRKETARPWFWFSCSLSLDAFSRLQIWVPLFP